MVPEVPPSSNVPAAPFFHSFPDVYDCPQGGKAVSPGQLTISWSWAALVINKGMDAKPRNIAGGLIWMTAFKNLVLEMRNVICIKIR